MEEAYDYIICVFSDQEKAIERVISRDNTNKEQILKRMQNQLSPQEKKKKSDFVINNNSTLEELKKATDFVLDLIG